MNSNLVKLKIKNDNMVDTDIHHESIELKFRTNDLEALLNTRFRTIEN